MPSSNISKTWRGPTLRCAGSSASTAPTSCYRSTSASHSHIEAARSHADGDLAVLAKCRLRPGREGLGEFENSDRRARRPIPQFTGLRLDPQQAYIRIRGAAGPPHRVGQSPNLLDLADVLCHAGAGGDRQVSFCICIDEDKIDVGLGFDLLLLWAADISHDEDQSGLSIGPWLDGARPQSTVGLRRQHAHADTF